MSDPYLQPQFNKVFIWQELKSVIFPILFKEKLDDNLSGMLYEDVC